MSTGRTAPKTTPTPPFSTPQRQGKAIPTWLLHHCRECEKMHDYRPCRWHCLHDQHHGQKCSGNSSYIDAGVVTPQDTRNSQTIAFADPGPQQVGMPLTLTASATSGLEVFFSVSQGCTLTGNTLSFAAAEWCMYDNSHPAGRPGLLARCPGRDICAECDQRDQNTDRSFGDKPALCAERHLPTQSVGRCFVGIAC